MTLTKNRPRKVAPLKKGDMVNLKKWVKKQPTLIDACLDLEISRPTLDRILGRGTASTKTIEKIKSVIDKK